MNVNEPFVRQARARPRRVALIANDRQISYGQLLREVTQFAGALDAAGVRRGDVVALAKLDRLAHLMLTLALGHLGAVSASLPSSPAHNDAAEALARACGVKFMLHNAAHEEAIPRVGKPLSVRSLLDLKPPAGGPAMARMEPADLWRIGTSSGTTGNPKGMRFTHGGTVAKALLMGALVPIRAGDRVMIGAGLGLPFALAFWLRTLYAGGAVVLPPIVPHEQLMEALWRHRPTQLVASPGTAAGLVKLARQAQPPRSQPLPELKVLCLGGSNVPAPLQESLRRHLCDSVFSCFGASEVGVIALSDPELGMRDADCAGRLVPWVEAEVVGDDDIPLPAGEQGLLRARSPCMAAGYVDTPANGTGAGFFRDGWFYSNDLATLSDSGLVHLGGRQSDLLNLGGEKMDPARLEAVILEDPEITECAAFTVAARLGEPVLVAVIVATGNADDGALKQRCSAALGPRFVPKAVFRVPALPRNEGGKVMLDALRQSVKVRDPAAAPDRDLV